MYKKNKSKSTGSVEPLNDASTSREGYLDKENLAAIAQHEINTGVDRAHYDEALFRKAGKVFGNESEIRAVNSFEKFQEYCKRKGITVLGRPITG